MYIPFNKLAPESRMWIYQANRVLTNEEAELVSTKLKAFCDQWLAHGHPLKTSFKIEYNLFLILAVDENVSGASGCSIDGSVRMLKEFQTQLGIDFLDRSNIAFLVDNTLVLHKLADLKRLFNEGILTGKSASFNNALTLKHELETKWIEKASESWLSKYLPKRELV